MKKTLACLIALSLLPGCATIADGRHQAISVNTTPPDALCTFMRNGETLGSIDPTPGTLLVEKTKYDILIRCEKKGYQPATLVNHSGSAAMTFGNVLIGGLVGWGIDSATGSDNKYDSPVNITLSVVNLR